MSSSLEIPSVLQIVRRNTGSKPSIPSRSAKASSGYRGVSSQGNRWRARICIDKVEYTIGDFDTEDEAAQAYDIEAIKRGKLKYLNFVYKGLNDKPPEQKKRKPARKRKAQTGLDEEATVASTKSARSDAQASPTASQATGDDSNIASSAAGPAQSSLLVSSDTGKTTAGAERVSGVLHIPRETNPNLKARPKVRNRNGKKYARVADTTFMSADARYFPADFARASGDLFDPARVYFADTSVHEAQVPLYPVPSAESEQGPALPRAPANPYFSMVNAAPNKAGAAIIHDRGQHNAPNVQSLPLVAPPAPPLTAWGRMSAQAQQLANSFANSITPAVSEFGKSGTAPEQKRIESVDRAQAVQLLQFFYIPEVKIVLSDEMRQKLKYVVLTGGPQVLTMVDAAIEVFKLTDDIHELLDTLGHVYRVWLNAALALGLFGDYVPYMFSQQTKIPPSRPIPRGQPSESRTQHAETAAAPPNVGQKSTSGLVSGVDVSFQDLVAAGSPPPSTTGVPPGSTPQAVPAQPATDPSTAQHQMDRSRTSATPNVPAAVIEVTADL